MIYQFIIEGFGEFSYGTKKYELKAGDSFSFAADIPEVAAATAISGRISMPAHHE